MILVGDPVDDKSATIHFFIWFSSSIGPRGGILSSVFSETPSTTPCLLVWQAMLMMMGTTKPRLHSELAEESAHRQQHESGVEVAQKIKRVVQQPKPGFSLLRK